MTDKADATPVIQSKKAKSLAEEISFDDAMDVLGSDGLDAVAGVLDMFRNTQRPKRQTRLTALQLVNKGITQP